MANCRAHTETDGLCALQIKNLSTMLGVFIYFSLSNFCYKYNRGETSNSCIRMCMICIENE